MSTKLQIVMKEEEANHYKTAAAREQMTLSAWVRRCLRRALRAQSGPTPEAKLEALDGALQRHHPIADMDALLEEIEHGRGIR